MTTGQSKLTIVPLTFRQASAFVAQFHRHNKPPRGCKFCIGVQTPDGKLCGVAMVGRPVARHFDDGATSEVNRTCTDGTANANSALYGACWRISKEMGYARIITYTQGDETGTTLRAVGWTLVKDLKPRGSWADSSKGALKEMRDPVGNGNVARVLWECRRGTAK